MKCLVQERDNEGLSSFLGKEVVLWCLNYIYAGKLVGINQDCCKLEDAKIVYETGSFDKKGWEAFQGLPGPHHYVQLSAVESFGHPK